MLECNTSGNSFLPQSSKVILFPGQGVQFVGMGKDVCDNTSRTKAVWDCASDIAGFDVRQTCLKGPMTRLTKTIYQQIAVTTVNIAMYEDMIDHNEVGDAAFAGHSAGEYSALYAAGVFDLENLFKAMFARASIMQQMAETTDGMMFVVKDIPFEQLNQFIQEADLGSNVKIANDNSPRQQVISGDSEIVKHFSIHLQQSGFPQIKLPVNGAWHSHLMQSAEGLLRDSFSSIVFKRPKNPIYMNVTAENTFEPEDIKQNLLSHLTRTVRWRETMETLHQLGYQNYIEVGCKKVLTHLLSNHHPINETTNIIHLSEWAHTVRKAS